MKEDSNIKKDKIKLSIIKSQKIKSFETECWYCGSVINMMKTKKRHFCCSECRVKYFRGVKNGFWKMGDLMVNLDDKPIILNKLKGGFKNKNGKCK